LDKLNLPQFTNHPEPFSQPFEVIVMIR